MIIEQEKFQALKELSEIQIAISEGKAALEVLKTEESAYMQLREQAAVEHIDKVLKESEETLKKISTNHEQLTTYRTELQAYAISLKGFSQTLQTLFKDFSSQMEEAQKDMAVHRAKNADILKAIKIAQVNVDEDRKQLARERVDTENGMKLLMSQREALKSAWDHLKSKK